MADSSWNVKVGAVVDTSSVSKQLESMPKQKVTVTPVFNSKGIQTGKKVVKDFGDEIGNTVRQVDKLDMSGKKVSSTFTRVSQAINNTEKHTKRLSDKFVDITKKVIAFGAITSAIGLFTQAMSQAVKMVSEFDASLTELKKVSDLSGDGLDEYTQKAYSMARELSTSATNITDATTAFVQAGYSIDESAGLSKYAIMLQSIADETMETEVATNFLTSTMKAFNLTSSDAEHIISAVNETSNQYALTSNDLSENMGKVAGVAGIAGVSMEQLIGLMTASIEKTRNASKSANAFKSIFINLQQMNDSGTLPKLSKKFDDFGISMTESNGKIKSAYDLLHELADAYKQVSNSTDVDKQNKMRTLLEDIGG